MIKRNVMRTETVGGFFDFQKAIALDWIGMVVCHLRFVSGVD